MFNFNNDYDLIPRTYSIKSYRRKESSTLKKVVKYSVYILIVLSISAAAVLSYIR